MKYVIRSYKATGNKIVTDTDSQDFYNIYLQENVKLGNLPRKKYKKG